MHQAIDTVLDPYAPVAISNASATTEGGDVCPIGGEVSNRAEVLIASIIIGHHFTVISPNVLNRVVSPPYVLGVTVYF
jgi:hypothetical protein